MRKKLLLVVVCVALFLGAVGAYSYVVIAGFRSDVDSLQDTVSSLEDERTQLQNHISTLEDERDTLRDNVSALESQVEDLQNELSHKNSKKTFNFYWEGFIAEYFNTTRFWMNVTFERVTIGNGTIINITVKVNELQERGWFEYVGIVSDITGSWLYRTGTINEYFVKQQGGLGDYSGGQRFIDIVVLHLTSSNHEVQYDPELGFTYIIPSYALEGMRELAEKAGGTLTDRIHIEYAHTVAVEFCFGEELIA